MSREEIMTVCLLKILPEKKALNPKKTHIKQQLTSRLVIGKIFLAFLLHELLFFLGAVVIAYGV